MTSDLQKLLLSKMKLEAGKWRWSGRPTAEEIAKLIYGELPDCPNCKGFGRLKTGMIPASELGSDWSAWKHLSCRVCGGTGKQFSKEIIES